MTDRHIMRRIRGMDTSDGAGVKLKRVIGQPGLDMLDPFLLLDEFRSDSADDYIAGFPEHPHRGFETVTYMLAGQHDPAEMIRSVKKGLYAVNFGGGQVDITSGKYVFSATEAYLIEDGKVTAPVKGATLIGNGPETMQKVKMIGHDLALDAGVGVCGKDGQSVPVGVGQPSLLISEITVGGTQAS